MKERLQKILSQRGICSRRKAEEYLERALVLVNGKVAKLGDKADPEHDTVTVDGVVLEETAEFAYYVFHKPVGVVTTAAPRKGQKTLFDVLSEDMKNTVFPVGRLDKDTSGLLIFTNDGRLAYRLTHPKFDHEKEYIVQVEHEITDGQLKKLRDGITISGVKTKPAIVRRVGNKNFTIALTEGKNRQIRRMCQKVGTPVENLQRIRVVNIEIV